MKIPIRYVPFRLSRKDGKKQIQMLKKSRKYYKKRQYYTRKKLPSFHNKPSPHVAKAYQIYHVDSMQPSPKLAKATGCNLETLRQIVKKGEGAYFSSGSRPNQTAQSWGLARLASSLTAGKAASVDYKLLEKGCHHRGKAFILANQSKNGHSHTKRRIV